MMQLTFHFFYHYTTYFTFDGDFLQDKNSGHVIKFKFPGIDFFIYFIFVNILNRLSSVHA